eukprot:Skav233167  [mRNA]  locus=scaffold1620:103392:104336:+ [translate_table: standard]
MKRAFNRIMRGVGRERFQEDVIQRFPLALNDHAVLEVATPMGFSAEWCHPKKQRPQQPNGNLNDFFGSGAGAVASPMAPPRAAPPRAATPMAAAPVAARPMATPTAPPAATSGRVTGRVGGGGVGIAPPAAPLTSAVPRPAPAGDVPSAPSGDVRGHSDVPVAAPADGHSDVPVAAPADGHSDVPVAAPADGHSDVPHPAAAGPGTSAMGGSDTPQCCICHEDMLVSQARIALPCSHTFHEACIMEWRTLCNKSDEECPLRCHLSNQAAFGNTHGFEVVDEEPASDGNPDEASTEGISESEINAAAEAVRESLS